jgi:YggT family protein
MSPEIANYLNEAIIIFANVLQFLIIARIIMTWLPVNKDGPIPQLLFALTEPILAPIRNLIRRSPLGSSGMPLDLSPILAILFIVYIASPVIRTVIWMLVP